MFFVYLDVDCLYSGCSLELECERMVECGTKDFAGGNAIHISAGISALAIVLAIRDLHSQSLKKKNLQILFIK